MAVQNAENGVVWGAQGALKVMGNVTIRWNFPKIIGVRNLESLSYCVVLAPTALDPSLYLALRAQMWLRFHN